MEPEAKYSASDVLLFLHGKGEAGTVPNDLPLVCVHQTPPFQALLGRLPRILVIAPQAKASSDAWNWREHLNDIANFLKNNFRGRRIVATGFSRGGLGVLQTVSRFPGLVKAWAVVDPQPTTDEREIKQIKRALTKEAVSAGGWLRSEARTPTVPCRFHF